TAVAHLVEMVLLEPDRHRDAADEPAFLVGETDDLQRMPGRNVVLLEYLGDFDGADHADVAVVVAAAGHGVDVRAEHDHGQAGLAAFAAPDEVAGCVDAHLEPGLAHQFLDVFAARDIGIAEGDAADAAFRVR